MEIRIIPVGAEGSSCPSISLSIASSFGKIRSMLSVDGLYLSARLSLLRSSSSLCCSVIVWACASIMDD